MIKNLIRLMKTRLINLEEKEKFQFSILMQFLEINISMM